MGRRQPVAAEIAHGGARILFDLDLLGRSGLCPFSAHHSAHQARPPPLHHPPADPSDAPHDPAAGLVDAIPSRGAASGDDSVSLWDESVSVLDPG